MALPVRFLSVRRPREIEPAPGEAVVALQWIGWDDFGYRTTFKLHLAVDGRPFVEVGEWKILNLDCRKPDADDWQSTAVRTELPPTFERLSEAFVALGQDIASYRTLFDHAAPVAPNVLAGLRDVAIFEPEERVLAHDGFDKSLRRFPTARLAFEARREVATKSAEPSTHNEDIRFHVSCPIPGFESPHKLTVHFSRRRASLGLERMAVLVGRNGTGKTRLLAALAQTLSGLEAEANIDPLPSFRRVIAVSYGAWDRFTRPTGEGGRIAYVYCGLRTDKEDDPRERLSIDVPRAQRQAIADLAATIQDADKRTTWLESLSMCGIEGDRILTAVTLGDDAEDELARRSSGEQVAIIILTRLVRHLVKDTLVLFDEPEVHTHPLLLSGMLRALSKLLIQRDAFALLATHSPIPVQEIPGKSVFVIEEVERHPTVGSLGRQSFGAGLDDILAMAFRTRQDERNWASFVRECAERGLSPKEILGALGGSSSLGVSLLLAALEKSESDDAAES